MRIQQKNLIQYKDTIKRPLLTNKQKSLTITKNSAKQMKQLISIQEKPFQEASNFKSSRFSNEANQSLNDSMGYCYYKKVNYD